MGWQVSPAGVEFSHLHLRTKKKKKTAVLPTRTDLLYGRVWKQTVCMKVAKEAPKWRRGKKKTKQTSAFI